MTHPESIADVLERHLARAGPTGAAAVDDELARVLKALGLDPGAPALPDAVVLGALEEARRAGLDPEAMFAMSQAYGRGLGRIAAAEAEIVRRLVRAAPREARAAALDDLLSRTIPLATLFLQAVHRARLWSELQDNLHDEALEEADAAQRTIALVDLVSSTSFLAQARPGETEQMVDAIHEVGQECTVGRPVAPVKFAGDGVFLLGRDSQEVIATAIDAVHSLDGGELPCRARAGLATGPVVRRAGDYFGLPVNLTERLAQAAPAGTVLAERTAAGKLPGSIVGEEMTHELRGIPGQTATIALRRRDER